MDIPNRLCIDCNPRTSDGSFGCQDSGALFGTSSMHELFLLPCRQRRCLAGVEGIGRLSRDKNFDDAPSYLQAQVRLTAGLPRLWCRRCCARSKQCSAGRPPSGFVPKSCLMGQPLSQDLTGQHAAPRRLAGGPQLERAGKHELIEPQDLGQHITERPEELS